MARDAPQSSESPVVVVPVAVLEGQTVPETLAAFLVPAEVVVLGYHVVPEQTPTEQASLQFEERARAAVTDVADLFREAGATVESRVAFTHDREQTVERVADEVGATAVLLPNPTGAVRDVLVALRGAVDVERLADLVAALLEEGRVTVWGLAGGEFDAEAAVDRARETLLERGVDADRIATRVTATETPVYDVVEASGAHDAIVMGAGGPTILSALLGEDAERVAEGAAAPVLVVRGRRETP